MAVDYEFWKFWMMVANFGATLMLAIYLFLTNRSRVNTVRIDRFELSTNKRIENVEATLRKDVDGHHNWLERMEERNKHTPTHEDFKRVYDKVNHLSDMLNSLSGESKAQNKTLDLIHEYLLNEGKK